MKVRSVAVKGFKRFTDLHIEDIPATARLVVLVGPNGCGKTSLLEVFNFWSSQFKGLQWDADYLCKQGHSAVNWGELMARIQLQFHDVTVTPNVHSEAARKAFYFRSAYRHEAEFQVTNLALMGDSLDDINRPAFLTRVEQRVSDNYQRIVAQEILRLHDPDKKDVTAGEIVRENLGTTRASVERLFGDVKLLDPGQPLKGGTFRFAKGGVTDFSYKNLSAGEKAAFDLLLDLSVKVKSFDDTVFVVDEPELHIHPRLQAPLLQEILDLLPQRCQLWISTQAIGMLRWAMDYHRRSPGEVVFLDFGNRDFDSAQVIKPATVDRRFWQSMFEVALDDFSKLIAPSEIVVCEGAKETKTRHRKASFDATIYRTVFRSTHPDTEFIPGGGEEEVQERARVLRAILGKVTPGVKVWAVRDRDYLNTSEVDAAVEAGVRVLRRRDIENYLWDDEVIRKLCNANNRPDSEEHIRKKRDELLEEGTRNSKPPDDVAAASGRLYNEVRILLSLPCSGSDARAFALTDLAPLITPDTAVYREIEEDVFGAP